MQTLSVELGELRLGCIPALLDPAAQPLVVRYWSSELLDLIEKLVGVK